MSFIELSHVHRDSSGPYCVTTSSTGNTLFKVHYQNASPSSYVYAAVQSSIIRRPKLLPELPLNTWMPPPVVDRKASSAAGRTATIGDVLERVPVAPLRELVAFGRGRDVRADDRHIEVWHVGERNLSAVKLRIKCQSSAVGSAQAN